MSLLRDATLLLMPFVLPLDFHLQVLLLNQLSKYFRMVSKSSS
jgi:hypothetical protein